MAFNIEYKKVVTGQYGNKDNITEVIKKVIHTELDGYKVEKQIKKLKVKSVKKVDNQPVYDIAVNNNQNFFADNLLVHNCFEIAFKPITEDGRCGVQFCNLSSINGAKVKNLEDWKQAIESATIIGTLQAGYTDFPYLSKTSEELTKEEALLGVSLTGWFDNPKLLLNEENQYTMSKLAIKVNKEWASKININQASRITCVKPEGTSSLVLGSSSGIHPHHAHRYFRRVQMNKLDNVYNYFKIYNPHATEESVWSATKSDDVVTFPLTVPKNAIVKSDLTAIEHLNYIRKTQENWVNSGITEVNKKPVSHNVSCTVEVNETEWDKVIDYLYENRKYFSAVSLLPKIGDNMYKQAPLQRVYPEDESKWNDLVENWKPMDWEYFNENEDFTKLMEQLACAGGSCEVPWEKNAS